MRSVPGLRPRPAGEPATPVVLLAHDPLVVETVGRIAGAVGVAVAAVSDVAALLGWWGRPSLVLVDSGMLPQLAAAEPPRRPGVVVVAGLAEESVWRSAVSLGAEHVALLPEGEEWLGQRMAAAAEGPSRSGTVVAVVGGRGGAGASTLAAGLALSLPAPGRALLLDLDPLGGGIDLLVGAEEVPGRRWSAFTATRGRLGVETLRAALPEVRGLRVLSFDRDDPREPEPPALESVLDAAVRGFDLVVADLPRPPAAAAAILARADRVLLVTTADVRGAAAAAAVLPWLPLAQVGLVVRTGQRATLGLPPAAVSESLGVAFAGELTHENVVAEAALRGDPPPLGREAFARLCRRLTGELAGEPVRP